MSGYDVCRVLKADERTREIPIIFISALNATSDKVDAFAFGAVDYITKPFQSEEVLARVGVQLKLRQEIRERTQAEQELKEANADLRNLLETLHRTQEQLIQSEKNAVLGSMVAGVAHEINTPIGVGVTAASHLDQQTRKLEDSYMRGELKRSALEQYVKQARESSGMILRNLERTAEIVQQFKQVAVTQSVGNARWFRVKTFVEDARLRLYAHLQPGSHTVAVDCDPELEIYSEPRAFSQILIQLLLNSFIHAFERTEHGVISVRVRLEADRLQLIVEDNGRGMSEEEQRKMFDPFYTTRRIDGNTGLGLHIVYNLVTQALEGEIHCESRPEQGTRFTIRFPVKQRKSP